MPKRTLDAVDLRIIAALQGDARPTTLDLAARVGLPVSVFAPIESSFALGQVKRSSILPQ